MWIYHHGRRRARERKSAEPALRRTGYPDSGGGQPGLGKARRLDLRRVSGAKPQAEHQRNGDRVDDHRREPDRPDTQFTRAPGKAWTQEPYRRDLLSDALRQASGVPPLAAQEQQRKDWARKLP